MFSLYTLNILAFFFEVSFKLPPTHSPESKILAFYFIRNTEIARQPLSHVHVAGTRGKSMASVPLKVACV